MQWVLRRGMPQVTANWTCDDHHKLAALTLRQQDVLPDGFVWPISNEVLLGLDGKRLRVDWNTPERKVPEAVGQPCPRFVFANAADEAYGRFLLGPGSESFVRSWLDTPDHPELDRPSVVQARRTPPEPLLRSMLWGALWENVRVAQSAPRRYVELVLRDLPTADDEALARIEGAHATQALHSYMGAAARAPLVPRLEAVAAKRMMDAPTTGLRIVSFRTLVGVTETVAAREHLQDLLSGKSQVPGVALRPLDRWGMVGRLVSLGDPGAAALVVREQALDKSGEADKYTFQVLAGTPNAAVKQRYFAAYRLPPTDKAAKPEDWLSGSLRPFNSWNQVAWTEPFVTKALNQLPEIKRDRKIFFLGVWLGAFLGGQTDAAALDAVHAWLAKPAVDPDLRRKVLENSDELERTVRIRQKFADGDR